MSINEMSKQLNITYQRNNELVKEMTHNKLLTEKTGLSRNRYYVLKEYLVGNGAALTYKAKGKLYGIPFSWTDKVQYS